MSLSWLVDGHEISFKRGVNVFLVLILNLHGAWDSEICFHAMNTERFCSAWARVLLVARASWCWLLLCFPAISVGSFSSYLLPQSHSSEVALCVLLCRPEWLVAWEWMHPAFSPCAWAFGIWFPGQFQFGLLRWLLCSVLFGGPKKISWEAYQMVWE